MYIHMPEPVTNLVFNRYPSLKALSPEQRALLIESSDHLAPKGYGIDFLDKFFQGFDERYQDYKQNKFVFGRSIEEQPANIKSKTNQIAINFIFDQNKIQESLLHLIKTGASSEDIHNFLIMSQKMYEDKTGHTDTSPFIKEFHKAAQKAVSTDPQLKGLLNQSPTDFLYNPNILGAAINELSDRHLANSAINSKETRNSGILQRFQDFGFLEGFTISALISAIGFGGDLVTGNAFEKKAGGWLFGYSKKSGLDKALNGDSEWTKYFNGNAKMDMAKKFGWDPQQSKDAFAKQTRDLSFLQERYESTTRRLKLAAKRKTEEVFDFVLPNGETHQVGSKKELDAIYKKYLKKNTTRDIAAQCSKDIQIAISAKKTKVKEAGKFLSKARAELWKTRLGSFAKHLPKKLGSIVAGLAALGWGISQFSSNPNYTEPANELYEGASSKVAALGSASYQGAKSLGQGTLNFVDDWFIPDNFGVLLFGPSKEEYA